VNFAERTQFFFVISMCEGGGSLDPWGNEGRWPKRAAAISRFLLPLSEEISSGRSMGITGYETVLWRRFLQTAFALDAAKRQLFILPR